MTERERKDAASSLAMQARLEGWPVYVIANWVRAMMDTGNPEQHAMYWRSKLHDAQFDDWLYTCEPRHDIKEMLK